VTLSDSEKTLVVNVRSGQYDVYIGRYNKSWGLERSPFFNPFREWDGFTLDEAIHYFRIYFFARILNDPEFKALVDGLKGKRLACWCHPKPCHGNVIVEYLEISGTEAENRRTVWQKLQEAING